MLNGVMLLWFVLTALSLAFVMIDIRSTPESPVLKWGFILLTAYTGPIGAFLYVLGCREPLPGLHERYVAVRWRQVLGSTMHCVAGDGVGILAGAVVAGFLHLAKIEDIALEYVLGFGFGWAIFQSLFMRDMTGGSYLKSLSSTFFPELLSMNCLMAGMVPVMSLARLNIPSHDPSRSEFWFVMSIALLAGFITAYPMNWWLVTRGLKHGMMTVRPVYDSERIKEQGSTNNKHHSRDDSHAHTKSESAMNHDMNSVSTIALAGMTVLSCLAFGLGLTISFFLQGI